VSSHAVGDEIHDPQETLPSPIDGLLFPSMALERVQPQSTDAIIADAIRRRIAYGVLKSGDRLPTERELAETLGVGRMTIRSAIRTLNNEGLLETSGRGRAGGTFVSERTPTKGIRARLAERYASDVQENYRFRLVVEPFVARLSAERSTDQERELLVALASHESPDISGYRATDSQFHLLLAEMCCNQQAAEAVRRARAEFFIWADALWDQDWDRWSDGVTRVRLEHEAIARAVASGDAQAAEKRMQEHLARALAGFQEVVERLRD
jgi:GntR family transcriptional repressor for pyruvate dehydrogenase complex